MSYSRTLRNVLIGIFVILSLFFYKFCSTQFNLPTYISSQWYSLTGVLVVFISFGSVCMIPMYLALLFEVDKYCREMRATIYNALGDHAISVFWQIIVFIMTAILFQYGYYMISVALFCIGLNLMTFRMMHRSIIRKALSQVLKN